MGTSFFDEGLGRHVPPRRIERHGDEITLRGREEYVGAATTAPGAGRRGERGAPGELEKVRLLLGRELHHSLPAVRMDRGENPAADPEVRMAHVRLLDGFGKAQGQLAELPWRHR